MRSPGGCSLVVDVGRFRHGDARYSIFTYVRRSFEGVELMMKNILVVIAVGFLTACAAPSSTLVNDQGLSVVI